MSKRYAHSESLHQRALDAIPLGSQTFSKSKTQYPFGVSPFFIQKARGSRVWDVDGNSYIDYVNSLSAVTLGYNDPDVTAAVQAQLEEGSIFSLPHPVEVEVAEALIDMVPCAQKVRYGKNGSDATSGAIRLARAYTGRDHICTCGYHGWQDWYIGSTPRGKGVPNDVKKLTHSFIYNDIDSLHRIFEQYPDQIAAVILEPMNSQWPKEGFLEAVQDLAKKHGALLVFDETITGFRFHTGGAQALFGVTPDLATFGKGIANGYPLSALVGRADVMKEMEEIFFSFTFGGETLSLAAAKATLKKLKEEPVIQTLSQLGTELTQQVNALLQRYDLDKVITLSGHPSWTFLTLADTQDYTSFQIKTFLLQECFKRGILMIGTHTMGYAHSEDDIAETVRSYEDIFPALAACLSEKTLLDSLECDPLEPLFRIR